MCLFSLEHIIIILQMQIMWNDASASWDQSWGIGEKRMQWLYEASHNTETSEAAHSSLFLTLLVSCFFNDIFYLKANYDGVLTL